MLKKWSYALLMLALCITISHSLVAHDHHVVRAIEHDEHDDDGDDDHSAHTFFSYGHIEESFVPSHDHIQVKNDFVALVLFTCPAASVFLVKNVEVHKSILEISPPPGEEYSATHALRGPPAFIG